MSTLQNEQNDRNENRPSLLTDDYMTTLQGRLETGKGNFDLLIVNDGKGHPAMYQGLTSAQCAAQATIH